MPNIPPTMSHNSVAQYKNVLANHARTSEKERHERDEEKAAMEAAAEKAAMDADIAGTKAKMVAEHDKLRGKYLGVPTRNNPHMNFFRSKREQIMRENPGMSPTTASKIMAAMWRDMAPEERHKFSDDHALKVRKAELAGLFGGKKRRRTAKKMSKKHRRRRMTRKH